MPKNSLADVIVDWEKLLTNLLLRKADLPGLQALTSALVPELEEVLAEVRAMGARLDAKAAVKQQETKDRRALLKRGGRIVSRLRAALKAQYGVDSELLVEFGSKPIRPRSVPAAEAKTPKPGGNPAPAEDPESQKS
jgi:hypothetical protein